MRELKKERWCELVMPPTLVVVAVSAAITSLYGACGGVCGKRKDEMMYMYCSCPVQHGTSDSSLHSFCCIHCAGLGPLILSIVNKESSSLSLRFRF